jgi:hypothetical protein
MWRLDSDHTAPAIPSSPDHSLSKTPLRISTLLSINYELHLLYAAIAMVMLPQAQLSAMLLCLDAAQIAASPSSPNPQYVLFARHPAQVYEAPLYGCDGSYGGFIAGNHFVHFEGRLYIGETLSSCWQGRR